MSIIGDYLDQWWPIDILQVSVQNISDYSRLVPVDVKYQIYCAYLGPPKHLFSDICGCFVYAESFLR